METETKSNEKNSQASSTSSTARKDTNLNEAIDETSSLPKQVSSELNAKHDLKFRENLYRLIISQLFYDGYQSVAVALSGHIQVGRNFF